MRSFMVAIFLFGLMVTQVRATTDRIVTASDRGTYIDIGRDIARFVAHPAGIALEAVPSKGSTENVRRLRDEPGVRLALVQSDVYRALQDEARAGDANALRLIKPLRVFMPLYDEEIHFVTRADAPIKHIHEIRGLRINVGPLGSGTALTATTVYRAMFGTQLPDANAAFLSNEEALVKLVTDRSLDVVVIVAGQPARLFTEMKSDARRFIKLLAFDPQAKESQGLTGVYSPALIRQTSYPKLLVEDVPTLSVKSLLATYDFQSPGPEAMLIRLAHSMCANFDRLKVQGHAKWQQVSISLPPLGRGWSYYEPTQRVLTNCSASQPSPHGTVSTQGPTETCPRARQVLGLCEGPGR